MQYGIQWNSLMPFVAHLFRLGGNLMYIEDVHYCTICTMEKSRDFSLRKAIGPFVNEMSAPLRGKINVILCASMGHMIWMPHHGTGC